MTNMFLKEKTVSILIALLENKKSLYVSEVAKKSDCMYPYAFGVLKKFEEKGFVTSKKEGRTRYFTLTASGKKIASSLRKTQDMIRQTAIKEFKPKYDLKVYAEKIKMIKSKLRGEMPKKKIVTARRVLGRYRSTVSKFKALTESERDLQENLLSEIERIYKKLE